MENTSQEMKTARETAATAIKAAHEFAKEMREAKAAGKSVGEIEAKFDAAYADFQTAQKEVSTLEKLDAVTEEYERIQRPAADKTFRRLGIDVAKDGIKELHRESFQLYLAKGPDVAAEYLRKNGPAESFALLGSQDDLGGFLVPEDWRAEIIKDLVGFATFRQAGARVVPTSRSELVFPSVTRNSGTAPNPNLRSSNYAGTWRQQGAQGTDGSAPGTQNQPTFGQERIPVHIWQPDAVVLTEEFLEDSAVPVESILSELIAEARAFDEDFAFLKGDGVQKPLGLLDTSNGIATVNSGAAAAQTYGGIVDMYTGLPSQYRQTAQWMMNSATYGAILKLESTGGFLLFPPNSLPGTLMGKPVVFNEYMANTAASAKPIVFGAFRYYVIAERTDLRVKRLVERFAPNIGILPTARVGGKVVRNNAFRIQVVSA